MRVEMVLDTKTTTGKSPTSVLLENKRYWININGLTLNRVNVDSPLISNTMQANARPHWRIFFAALSGRCGGRPSTRYSPICF